MRRIISFALFGLAPFLIALPILLATAPWWLASALVLLCVGLISLYIWTVRYPRTKYPMWSKGVLAVLVAIEIFFLLFIYEPQTFAYLAL